MRMLPDNPSVDFLRQEAKELLTALRESNASASLADAQRALAEQYGFRTWADLKAECEARRAAPPAADPALAAGLADAFGLGSVVGEMTAIAYEYMGRRWKLTTSDGEWLVTPVFDWIGDAQAAVAADLRERARAAGVSAPKPVRAPDGGLVKRIDGSNWRVDEWMEFGPKPVVPVPSAFAARVGDVLAAIHGLAIPTTTPITWFLTSRHSDADWQSLAERAMRANKPWLDDFLRLVPAIEELRRVPSEQPSTPLIVSICDLNPDAVRMGRRDETVVVHWEFSGSTVPEWELAHVLVHWGIVGADINEPAVRALVDAYRRRAGSVPPLDVSSFTLAITAWLNWTFNQVCEAIDPETPEQAAFAERELRDIVAAPLSTATIERLLALLEPATA